MALVALAQAVTTTWFGPCSPYWIDSWALAALPISLGMVKAETLSGPLSISRWCWISIVSRPPMPEPRTTPQRQGFSLAKSRPESRTALTPLTWANCTKRSKRLTSLASI